jgi:hypothetical protein
VIKGFQKYTTFVGVSSVSCEYLWSFGLMTINNGSLEPVVCKLVRGYAVNIFAYCI